MTQKTIRAKVHFLAAPEGGRSTPVRSGYRSLLRFGSSDIDFGFELSLDSEALEPGEEGSATLSFWAVGALPPLSPGREFEIREGAQVVGGGVQHGAVVEND